MSDHTLEDTLHEFDAGIFMNKTAEALKQVALGVINNSKKGAVIITLELDRIGESDSVQIKHTLKYKKPTMRGSITEDNATTTPMHVSRDGTLSISPQTQTDVFNSSTVTSINKGAK